MIIKRILIIYGISYVYTNMVMMFVLWTGGELARGPTWEFTSVLAWIFSFPVAAVAYLIFDAA